MYSKPGAIISHVLMCNTLKFIPSNKGDFNIKDKEDLQFY